MIAKIISWAPDRDRAIKDLKKALDGTAVWPVKSNAGFLYRLLEDEEFLDGSMTTGLIASRGDDLLPEAEPTSDMLKTAALHLQREYVGLEQRALTGFRLNASPRDTILVSTDSGPVEARIPDDWIDGVWSSAATPTTALVSAKGVAFAIGQHNPHGEGGASAADGAILAPMPGKVIAVDVAEGESVTAGQRLMVLEAMKMEHALTAPFDGTVTELAASEGGQVQVEAVLCVVEPSEE